MLKLQNLNGVLFAGGNEHEGYFRWAKNVYEEVKRLNDAGQFLPLWGTCLGFEDIMMYESPFLDKAIEVIENHDQVAPLNFLPTESALWSSFGTEDLEVLQTQAITYLSHTYGFSLENFNTDTGLSAAFKATATQKSDSGREFVAAVESKRYPFYGVQFHPEKPLWSYVNSTHVPHDEQAALINRKFADFFVS